jgi:hypothetical protein
MTTPEWVKPGLYGAAAGAIALAIVGFTWGGWVTGSKATQMATDKAKIEVLAALVPICLQQSNQDPKLTEKIAGLKSAKYYERGEMVMKTGWATMPGAKEPNRQVADACVDKMASLLQ